MKKFDHTWMNSQEKKIQELKQKNRELTETKMIYKPFNYNKIYLVLFIKNTISLKLQLLLL
jgi:hypothetical protein